MDYLKFAELTNHAAIEIDAYLLGRSRSFEDVEEFSRLLRENTLKTRFDFIGEFPHIALCRVMQESKGMVRVEEYALEMTLLRYELEMVRELPEERLVNLRGFLTRASSHVLATYSHDRRRYIA